jgi:biopolymer transport protein ExbB
MAVEECRASAVLSAGAALLPAAKVSPLECRRVRMPRESIAAVPEASPRRWPHWALFLGVLVLRAALCVPAAGQAPAGGGPSDPNAVGADAAQQAFNEAFSGTGQAGAAEQSPDELNTTAPPTEGIEFLKLLLRGGWLMWPIALMLLVVVVFAVERQLAIRRSKIIPEELISSLGTAAQQSGGLDPRTVYKVCQQFPSAASNVLRSTLLKVGRPHSEVELAFKDACEREANKLYANVRPLNLAAAVAPLLGLLGTVYGMIQVFAQLATGTIVTNKAARLADGIYTALVTTLGGLGVAIPAAILAHWFEGRIQRWFREIDELVLGIMPQLERYEGKLRVARKEGRTAASSDDAAADAGSAEGAKSDGAAASTSAAAAAQKAVPAPAPR